MKVRKNGIFSYSSSTFSTSFTEKRQIKRTPSHLNDDKVFTPK